MQNILESCVQSDTLLFTWSWKPFDPFAIKVCKADGEIVGHFPMEISRIMKFLLDWALTSTVHLTSTYYRRSLLMQGGLEIANSDGYSNKVTEVAGT